MQVLELEREREVLGLGLNSWTSSPLSNVYRYAIIVVHEQQ